MLKLILSVLLMVGCATTQTENIELADLSKQIVEEVELEYPCLDQDVWVYFKHPDVWSQTCIVIVHVPKHSLAGDEENCPAQDTKVIGNGRIAGNRFFGVHVVTMKKGLLNDPKYYTTNPPVELKYIPDGRSSWQAKGELK